MISEWDDTPWGGESVTTTEAGNVVRMLPAKAATGWESVYTPDRLPVSSTSASPLRRMREEQAAYWVNPWILVAENAVTRRVRGLPWHLEDDDEDTVEDQDGNAAFREIAKLLEKPQGALPSEQRQVGVESWTNLLSLTSRHLGLCGMTHWFLDGVDSGGLPENILYVNPARLWPLTTTTGHLVAWLLDPADDQGRRGEKSEVLRRDQVLTFYLTPPDGGALVTGLVHAARTKSAVTGIADLHALNVFGGGGRLGGLVSPKAGTLDDEQYKTLSNELRSVQEAPDAAKRLTIIRGPVDFTPTSANMQQLDLSGIASMNRDDILTIWGVPQSQAPVATPAGLNSGDTKKYDEAVLYQGAVHDRVVPISQTIQLGLLDRYPVQPQIVIEEPTFDDDTPAFTLAQTAKDQPLTRNERRKLMGYDPLPDYGPDGDPLGLAIDLPIGLTTVGQGEEGPKVIEGRFTRVPPEPEVRVLPPIMPPALPANVPEPAKAGGISRAAVVRRFEPAIRRAVASFLDEQRAEITQKIRDKGEHLAKKPTDSRVWWSDKWDKRLLEALKKGVAGVGESVATSVEAKLGQRAKADPFTDSIIEALLRTVATRVTGINLTTRDAIAGAVADAFGRGLSPAQTADLIEQATSFGASRAELIARTETALTYNQAAVESYRHHDVANVEVIDGDEDDECATANGQTWTLEEAEGNPIGHPNCVRDFIPLFA